MLTARPIISPASGPKKTSTEEMFKGLTLKTRFSATKYICKNLQELTARKRFLQDQRTKQKQEDKKKWKRRLLLISLLYKAYLSWTTMDRRNIGIASIIEGNFPSNGTIFLKSKKILLWTNVNSPIFSNQWFGKPVSSTSPGRSFHWPQELLPKKNAVKE